MCNRMYNIFHTQQLNIRTANSEGRDHAANRLGERAAAQGLTTSSLRHSLGDFGRKRMCFTNHSACHIN